MTDPSPESIVRVEIDGPAARVVLADPARRNALSLAMFDGLERALDRLQAASVVAASLEAEGPAFCAGFDLAAAAERAETLVEFVRRLGALVRSIRRMETVLLAAVQGPALAGGAAIVFACDLLAVTPEARLGYPAVRLGISPAVSLPTLLPAVGGGEARRLLLSGELVNGREAMKRGFAAGISENPESLRKLAAALVRRIASSGPQAVRATKRWCGEDEGTDEDSLFEVTTRATESLALEAECRTRMIEALAARRSKDRDR